MPTGASSSRVSVVPKELPLEFLKEITDGFSSERVIAEVAFGTYYKGILPDGSVISVKKINADNSEERFRNEVANLMAIRHENVVKLVGFCFEADKKVIQDNARYTIVDVHEGYLSYEYCPNGSLEHYITAPTLDWATRFKIIKGICQGLHFLHKGMDGPVIHMHLNPNTILLDENMAPKIADFGLSRLFSEEQTRMYTVNVVGSCGYMAPEYLYRGEISTQVDIYSLGLLIIEIATGEKNQGSQEDISSRNWVENVRQKWTMERITSIYSALDALSLEQLDVCVKIGLQCVEIERRKRPTIEDIVNKLDGRL